jgi:hypothetical protein
VGLGDPQSLNLYSYVENDPVNRVDPTGKSWGFVAGALVSYVSSYVIDSVTIKASLNDPITGGAGSSSDQMLIVQDPVELPEISAPKITAPVQPPPDVPTPDEFGSKCGVNPLTGEPGFTEGPWGTAVGGYALGHNGDPTWGSRRRHGTHHGVDEHAGSDGRDAVVANRNGTVRFVGVGGGGAGNMIVINHDNGLETIYMHLALIGVQRNQTVKKGEGIGYSGTSGRDPTVSDPHLHFEVRLNGRDMNPVSYLNSPCYVSTTPPPPPPPPRR